MRAVWVPVAGNDVEGPLVRGLPAPQRGLIVERAQGLCERCGRPGTDVHHRQPRQMGGTRRAEVHAATNLVLLCRDCHHHIEVHRDDGYRSGWLVHSWDDPASVPLRVWLYRMEVWLENDGSYNLTSIKN